MCDLDNAYLSSTSTVRGWETLPAYTPKAGKASVHAAAPVAEAAAAPGGESWKMTLKTPMGPQDMVMSITRDGNSFSGRIESPMGSENVTGGKIDGDTLSWTMEVTKPAKIKLSFEVKVDGDNMTGNAKLGMFGKAALTGHRV